MLPRHSRTAIALAAFPLAMATGQAPPARIDTAGQREVTHLLRAKDGTQLLGRLLSDTGSVVRFATKGSELTVPKLEVVELREVAAREIRNGEYWMPDPHATRLFFGTTGRTLAAGEGYYSNTYLFFNQFVGGVSSRVTVGGGFSTFPVDKLEQNLFYLTPKVGLFASDRVNVAVGAIAGVVGGSDGADFALPYGVVTLGGVDASVTLGTGIGYADGRFARKPTFTFGGSARTGRRTSLISENYVVTTGDETVTVLMYGIRLFGEKLSVDLAFMNAIAPGSTGFFPGVPYVAFARRF
jgi:hypothetical protein